MHTIQLRINDNVYDHFKWLLNQFKKNEIEIIDERRIDADTIAYLQNELREMNEGKTTYHSMEELEQRLENKINLHETNNE
jgi:hypothetical protein